MSRTKLSLLIVPLLAGCSSTGGLKNLRDFTSVSCQELFLTARGQPSDQQLDRVSDLFQAACYGEVIQLASFVRDLRRDKFYSVSAEIGEIFTPEGTLTPYVLESYERSFSTLLISISYLNLNRRDDALAELRRSRDEENARLYNYGEDPVLSLLQAALWDRFDPNMARPYWKRLTEYKNQNAQLVRFAEQRLNEIDLAARPALWRIYGVGRMPDLDWQTTLVTAGTLYKITSTSQFPAACFSDDSLIMPTVSWTDKISGRYDSSYHPVLAAKSLVRLPVGIVYGLLGTTGGVAVGVGGCGLDFALESGKSGGKAFLCDLSIRAGAYIIGQSANLVEFTLKPDLRHWKNLPGAFVISREAPEEAGCLSKAAVGLAVFVE